jgi:hypothetical protein
MLSLRQENHICSYQSHTALAATLLNDDWARQLDIST